MKRQNNQQPNSRHRRRRMLRAFILQTAALFSCFYSFGPPDDSTPRNESECQIDTSDNRDITDDGKPRSFYDASSGASTRSQGWQFKWNDTPKPGLMIFEDGTTFSSGQFLQDSADGSAGTVNVIEDPDPRLRIRQKVSSFICGCSGRTDEEETDLTEIPFFAGLEGEQDNLLPYGEWQYRENERLKRMRLEFLRKLEERKERELNGSSPRANSEREGQTPLACGRERCSQPKALAPESNAAAATGHLQMLFRRAEERWTHPIPSTVSSEFHSSYCLTGESFEQQDTPIPRDDNYLFDEGDDYL